jgi:NADPH-dependent 2,4-dienoyl-CoA reductase/sulfur reductase-like enzyme
VQSLDTSSNEVLLQSGEKLRYDKLLIATGSSVFKPPIKGINAPNVHSVRTNHDQLKIKKQAVEANNIIVLGSSFVGSEAAASLAQLYGDKK